MFFDSDFYEDKLEDVFGMSEEIYQLLHEGWYNNEDWFEEEYFDIDE